MLRHVRHVRHAGWPSTKSGRPVCVGVASLASVPHAFASGTLGVMTPIPTHMTHMTQKCGPVLIGHDGRSICNTCHPGPVQLRAREAAP